MLRSWRRAQTMFSCTPQRRPSATRSSRAWHPDETASREGFYKTISRSSSQNRRGRFRSSCAFMLLPYLRKRQLAEPGSRRRSVLSRWISRCVCEWISLRIELWNKRYWISKSVPGQFILQNVSELLRGVFLFVCLFGGCFFFFASNGQNQRCLRG